ncbi:dihydrolipoamide acetyltransferase family protein [Streptomyces sp. NPDC052682]|uniref:dihydrolipoamide acetyltransferase family protein n=1 Tax=Streptomyces sp. NPDC052682 TaxID=3154954 RepID=UPI0034123964
MTTGSDVRVFRLPDLGEGLTEAEIVEWRVAPGEQVAVDQVVAEVETAKAVVEVPVPYEGVVLELHGAAGDMLPVGAPLITVGGEETPSGSGNVLVGYGTSPTATLPRPRSQRAVTPPATTGAAHRTPGAAPLVISPLVRALARRHGMDLTRVVPSGPYGVILRRDIEQALTAALQPTSPGTAEDDPAAADERIPLRGRRRTVADKLARSSAIPHATTWVEADATRLVEVRQAIRAADPARRIGLPGLLAAICVAGLRRYPELNSTVDLQRDEIVRLSAIHLGIAAQTERGLLVPVVHDAHRMTPAQLTTAVDTLTGQARTTGPAPKDLIGGTFTLNNYGVFGVDGGTPLINHPEAAILGVGRIADKPWVVDGGIAVRKVTQLALTFDHRVCDGDTAAGFLRYVADCLEQPPAFLTDPSQYESRLHP